MVVDASAQHRARTCAARGCTDAAGRMRPNLMRPLCLLALLALVIVFHGGGDADFPGRQLRQRRLNNDQQTAPLPPQTMLDSVSEDVGDVAWDWRPSGGAHDAATNPLSCRWHTFAPPGSLHGNASICLRSSADLLADEVRKRGYWAECSDLPAMLASAVRQATTTVDGQQLREGGPPIFVDVGANVGACSLHMLMTTDADVIAFEPGGDNLHYATQTFGRLADGGSLPDQGTIRPAWPEVRRRLLLIRAGVGAKEQEQLLHQAVGNAGHAVVGLKLAQYAPKGHMPAQEIVIRRLDEMLWRDRHKGKPPPAIALLKLDVEGYECQALTGMHELLRAGAIASMKLEVFDTLLQLQGCSAVLLQRMLVQAGFSIHKSENDALHTPKGPALSPDILHATMVGEPYNLWCVYHGSPPSPPTPATLVAGPPTPPPMDESGTAVSQSVPPNESWRLRRRYLSRKQRTARRLAEEKRRQLQRSRQSATL